jgi:hypothetical protein
VLHRETVPLGRALQRKLVRHEPGQLVAVGLQEPHGLAELLAAAVRQTDMARLMKGKAGLVTGAASAIGRACAIRFAQEGAAVVVADLEHSRSGAEETVRAIEEAGGQAEFFNCDVAESADKEALVARVVESYGSLDFARGRRFGRVGQRAPRLAGDTPVGLIDAVNQGVMRIATSYFVTEVRCPGVSPAGIAFSISSPRL